MDTYIDEVKKNQVAGGRGGVTYRLKWMHNEQNIEGIEALHDDTTCHLNHFSENTC